MEKKLVKKVLRSVRKGISCQKIADGMGLERQQVAAVKAHDTLHRYTGIPNDMQDDDKKRIVCLIHKGWPSLYILKKMPRYTRQQIAAVRAWVTRGKY